MSELTADLLDVGIPVLRSKFISDKDSRGFWILGFIWGPKTARPQVLVGDFGWRVLSCEDEAERNRLLGEANTRNALHDERLMLEPFAETLQAFGCALGQ